MIDLLIIGLLQAAAGDPAPGAAEAPAADAATQTPAPQTAETAPQPNAGERRVCRTETLSGSRVRRARICTTATEDAERQRTLHKLMDNMQNSHASQPGGGG